MGPRTILYTGKGGVGKTSVAAATARRLAGAGRRVIVVSTDPAHSLSDVLETEVGPEPTDVGGGVFARQVQAQRELERHWSIVQGWLGGLLAERGVDRIAAEELSVPPGGDELFSLLALKHHWESERWDAIVVDCAPTGETLRLLALPEALNWYVEKVFPAQRRALRAMRPLLSRVAGPAVPADGVFDAVERLHRELTEVRAVLTAPTTSVRVVLTPEAVVVAEARRTLTSLALYGYAVDGLVANRVFPASDDPWTAGWVAAQAEQLASVRRDVAPLPVLVSPYSGSEPVGLAALTALGEGLYGDADPGADAAPAAELLGLERTADGFILSISLPLARREDVDLARAGDELIVTVGGHRRVLALPSALKRCIVAGATLVDSRLRVRFEPDPDLWMRR
jgi:arsenite-transporting ATPase